MKCRLFLTLLLILIILISVNDKTFAINSTPHIIYGKVFNVDGTPPDKNHLETHAYITERPNEILEKTTVGCGYDLDSFFNGWLWFETGNYIAPWAIDETIRIIAINTILQETGVVDLILDSSGNQRISDVYLAYGDHVGPIASNTLIDGLNPASIPEGTISVNLTATLSDIICGNSNIQGAEYFINEDPGYGSGTVMEASDGIFDSPQEEAKALVNTSSWTEGSIHKVYVRGQDSANNWGTAHKVSISVKPADISNIVVFAANSVWLKQGSDVLSGDVYVNNVSSGPFLDSQVELSVGESVTTPTGYSLKADSIKVKQGADVYGNVFYNELTNNGAITGTLNTPLTLPLLSVMPEFKSAPSGTQYIEVAQDGFITLNEGDYGDIVVKLRGKILFTGGIYNIHSIDSRDHTQLLFAAPAEVRITDKFDSDLKAYIGPDEGSAIDASDIIFYVAGINGNTGNLGATPKAAQIGLNNTVFATFYVPNGTLWLRQGTDATGAFWGKDVMVGEDVQVILDSYFGSEN